ncbi:hypothetical protein PCL1606_08870 [Pseudomonas chlororaphis]|uniref:Uncharacterized protein n=1 Tax=Pseudomonas chlororaphis TaxID=587753 RepID=A0A0D5XTE6_9PSED|nr:hypothetical protein PCL1606_08870 [Pseudomonas chlororaphis]
MCLELKQPFQHVCSPWRAGRRECIDPDSKAQTIEKRPGILCGSEKAAHHTSSVRLWLRSSAMFCPKGEWGILRRRFGGTYAQHD